MHGHKCLLAISHSILASTHAFTYTLANFSTMHVHRVSKKTRQL